MSSPTSTSPSRDQILAASQRRAESSISQEADELRFDTERTLRQSFRRLLDPGILRGVEKKTAVATIKTLLTISENILNEPDNEKFRQFKPTNTLIKKTLVDVKGALEYAIEMGFRVEVQNFQPYYVFNPRKITELRIGAAILREAMERESEKEARVARSKQEAKTALGMQAKQVKLAFEDDRKRKAFQDKLERERRMARELAATSNAAPSSTSPEISKVPLQEGRTLASPPPYKDVDSDSE